MAKKETAPAAENVPAREGIVLNTISANCDAKNEIIVYQPSGGEFHIEVRVDDETVWLTQAQMAELFNATKQNVSLHISNIFEEGELLQNSTVKESLTVRKNPFKELDSDSGLPKSLGNIFSKVVP